ncbi:MAG: hypothetical protein AVDCRST_MAG18-3333 [uncultured Thermomicrobiales bacterium]|uniref:Uncharacterized protein n=1 Tax=uncultured Thermomicrobiales bacterium TaxID=1645740 RepID=A0A6J4VLL3_9BACT|nr:MAG: hypothetical protein AVDCRST_MAG18-3333 [uncultured Thermomicrobiales bacterium]
MAKARAPYPPTFRAAAVALAKTSGKGIPQFAPALGASAQALRGRIKCAEVDGGRGRPGGTDDRRAGGVAPPAARGQDYRARHRRRWSGYR